MLSLCLHLSSLNLCHLISAVIVILFGLDCFINSVLSLCSYSAHTLFDYKLELIICTLFGYKLEHSNILIVKYIFGYVFCDMP